MTAVAISTARDGKPAANEPPTDIDSATTARLPIPHLSEQAIDALLSKADHDEDAPVRVENPLAETDRQTPVAAPPTPGPAVDESFLLDQTQRRSAIAPRRSSQPPPTPPLDPTATPETTAQPETVPQRKERKGKRKKKRKRKAPAKRPSARRPREVGTPTQEATKEPTKEASPPANLASPAMSLQAVSAPNVSPQNSFSETGRIRREPVVRRGEFMLEPGPSAAPIRRPIPRPTQRPRLRQKPRPGGSSSQYSRRQPPTLAQKARRQAQPMLLVVLLGALGLFLLDRSPPQANQPGAGHRASNRARPSAPRRKPTPLTFVGQREPVWSSTTPLTVTQTDRARSDLRSPSPPKRRKAARTLAAGEADAADDLLTALTDAVPAVRDEAQRSLRLMARRRRIDVVGPIQRRLERATTRREKLVLIGALGHAGPAGVQLLERLLDQDSDRAVKLASLAALGQTGTPAAWSVIAAFVGHPDPAFREAACVAAGQVEVFSSIEALLPSLQDPEVKVREAAHWALERISGQHRAPNYELWASWWNAGVGALTQDLVRIEREFPELPPTEQESWLRKLRVVRDPAVVRLAQHVLSTGSPALRKQAATTLAGMGSHGRPAIEDLMVLLGSIYPEVREAAHHALRGITNAPLPRDQRAWLDWWEVNEQNLRDG
ncbi:MAG: HEAT repeat domain-containing protein [Planctomycetota bacterium]|jgi:HEAT repeat protein